MSSTFPPPVLAGSGSTGPHFASQLVSKHPEVGLYLCPIRILGNPKPLEADPSAR